MIIKCRKQPRIRFENKGKDLGDPFMEVFVAGRKLISELECLKMIKRMEIAPSMKYNQESLAVLEGNPRHGDIKPLYTRSSTN